MALSMRTKHLGRSRRFFSPTNQSTHRSKRFQWVIPRHDHATAELFTTTPSTSCTTNPSPDQYSMQKPTPLPHRRPGVSAKLRGPGIPWILVNEAERWLADDG